jgi:arylsulfatase A-like enzyme
VLFEAAFSTAPYTAPSHASLLTGRYPHEHGVQWIDEQPKLDERYPTLSEALRDRGYRTAAFSANVFWFTREKGFGRGFTRFEDYFRSSGDTFMRAHHGIKFMDIVLRRLGFEDIPGRRNAEDINRSVLRWIEGNTDKPFFAFVNYIDTHDPYFPPQPYRSQFSTVENPGGLINHAFSDSTPQMTPSQIQSEIDAYDGSISYADAQIAQLMADIRDRGLEDNLMVIVTSDHGEAFGEHGAFIHANSVYREEIHLPLIFWMPGQIPTGVRVAQPVTNASFRPPSWVSLARPIRIYSRLHLSSLFGKPRERILTGRSLWPKWNTGLICQRSLHPVKAQWSHW